MTTSIANLPRITASTLSSIILSQSPSPNPSIAIIDVRDDDHIGGHIIGSTHVPSTSLDHKIPELVRKLQDKEMVVFHCALSQQRGPGAALRYLRERERLLGAVARAATMDRKGDTGNETKGAGKGEENEGEENEGEENGGEENEEEEKGVRDQKVYVLDRGFVGWQERFGEDEKLTEGYRRELWKDGYWM